MSLVLRALVVLSGIVLIVGVLRDVIRKKMQERQSLFWIFTGLLLILVGLVPMLITLVSAIFGVVYAPSIIFSLVLLVLIFGLYKCFRANCQLEKQVKELACQVSLLNEEKATQKAESATKEVVK